MFKKMFPQVGDCDHSGLTYNFTNLEKYRPENVTKPDGTVEVRRVADQQVQVTCNELGVCWIGSKDSEEFRWAEQQNQAVANQSLATELPSKKTTPKKKA